MDTATQIPPPGRANLFLAGLQTGLLAVIVMLAWLGASAMWNGRTFWTAPNQMASIFHGNDAISGRFSSTTPSGIAVYVIAYTLLGAIFAVLVPRRLTVFGDMLFGVLIAIGWYWLWFRALGPTVMPLVWMLHSERSVTFGHVIYGVLLARYPLYLVVPAAAQSAAAVPLTTEN